VVLAGAVPGVPWAAWWKYERVGRLYDEERFDVEPVRAIRWLGLDLNDPPSSFDIASALSPSERWGTSLGKWAVSPAVGWAIFDGIGRLVRREHA
jgi:hypothetical protein